MLVSQDPSLLVAGPFVIYKKRGQRRRGPILVLVRNMLLKEKIEKANIFNCPAPKRRGSTNPK